MFRKNRLLVVCYLYVLKNHNIIISVFDFVFGIIMETCQQQHHNISSVRRKSIRYDNNRQRLFRYSVQNADRYLDQMIQSVKYGEDRNKQWKKQKELEPISQQGHQELLVKFRSKTCALKKQEIRKCGLYRRQRKMEQKQRTVSVCKWKLNRGQTKCIPLEDKISNKTQQETNLDKVEILRYIKEREISNILTQTLENININININMNKNGNRNRNGNGNGNINRNRNRNRDKMDNRQNKQKMKGITLNNFREFRKIYACSYSGKSIPILCGSANNNGGGGNSQSVNGQKDKIDFQVLDEEKVLFGEFCQGDQVNEICKHQKVIPTSTKIIYPAFTNYQNLELFSVENSEFLSNFDKIKFDPRIKEQRQQLKQSEQNYNSQDQIISLIDDADMIQKQASKMKTNIKTDNRNSKMVQYNPILQQYVSEDSHKIKLGKRRVTFRHLRS